MEYYEKIRAEDAESARNYGLDMIVNKIAFAMMS